MANILVLLPVSEKHKQLLESSAPGADFTYSGQNEINAGQVRNADIIIGNPPADMLKHSQKLKLLQLQSAGIGGYARDGILHEGVLLANASGAYGLAISEFMLGMLLELFKKLHLYRDNQRKSNWAYRGTVKAIYNSVALIVGAGDIGGEFARRIKALGAYTIGIRRRDAVKPEYLDELYFMDELEALLPRADIVALSLPATGLTQKIINEKTLKLMKNDAVIINVGRGSAIDTEALCDALENGRLLGAALDVTDPEPLPEEHRLWQMENAVITPHASGGFSLTETHDRIIEIAAANIKAFVEGRELSNIVDLKAGY